MPTELIPPDPDAEAPKLTHYPLVLWFEKLDEDGTASTIRVGFPTPSMKPELQARSDELKAYAASLIEDGYQNIDKPEWVRDLMAPGITKFLTTRTKRKVISDDSGHWPGLAPS